MPTNETFRPALFGFLAALAITTTMDATGYATFSALPLLPLTGLLWFLQKFSRKEMGLVWGNLQGYLLALAYPAIVLGLIGVCAGMTGAVDTSQADWNKTFINIFLMSSTGVLATLLTEEGFFRGWLWAALKRAGQSDARVLIWTSLAFTLWHVSAITLETGFDVPAKEVPIYLLNAALIGLIWGMLRMATGSVVAPALCHAVWNGIDYPLFGFGEEVGALGIQQTHIYGPEVGLLGLVLNLLFATTLWFWVSKRRNE